MHFQTASLKPPDLSIFMYLKHSYHLSLIVHFQFVSFPPFLSTFCNLLERKSYCQLSVWAKCHVRHVSCLAATFKSVFPPYIDIEEMWQRMVRIFLLWLRPLTSLISSQNCCFPLSTCSDKISRLFIVSNNVCNNQLNSILE